MARSKILVVDDDTAMREMMALALAQGGIQRPFGRVSR